MDVFFSRSRFERGYSYHRLVRTVNDSLTKIAGCASGRQTDREEGVRMPDAEQPSLRRSFLLQHKRSTLYIFHASGVEILGGSFIDKLSY